MSRYPEFADRLDGHKPTQLRARWRKLGTSDFSAKENIQLAAKRETVFDNIAAATPPVIAQSASAVAAAPAPVAQQAAAVIAMSQLAPPQPPFAAYRPYPTHIFDQPKKFKAKVAQTGTAADAELSTPMDMGPSKPRKRGRRPTKGGVDDESDFSSDEDSEDSEAAVRNEARRAAKGDDAAATAAMLKNEFKDMEENLDNIAYMHYYDHRDDSMLLYDTFSVPMRDLKRQFTIQYGMKSQDAVELMKAMTMHPISPREEV